MSEPYGPWRFRWAITGGLMVENTGARPIQSLRNFIWFEENFLKWFSLSGCPWFIDHGWSCLFFFKFADFFQFIRMFVTHQSSIRKHISHQGGKTAICTVMACTYTFQLALTRCQKFAKSLPFGVFSLQIASFIGFCDKDDTFASASWASRWTASLHLVPWSRMRPRMKMNGWGPFSYVISILLLTRNNQGFYFAQYLINTIDLYYIITY